MFIPFFDDAKVRTQSGLVAVPGPVEKLGVVPGLEDWLGEWALDAFSGSILPWPGGGYRAYVTAFNRADHGLSMPFVIASDDGRQWWPLGLVSVTNKPPDFAGYMKQPSVCWNDDGTVRMYCWCHGTRGHTIIGRCGVLHSEDGLTFHFADFDQPVLYHPHEFGKWGFEPGLVPTVDTTEAKWIEAAPETMLRLKGMRSNDSTCVYREPDTGQYVVYGVFLLPNPEGNPRREDRDNARSLLRVITRRVSDDGYHFGPPEIVMMPDEADPLDQQFYYLAVHRLGDWRVGLVGDYEIVDQTMDLGIALSRDGRHWLRPMRSPLIPRVPDTWESMSVYAIDRFIEAGDDMLLLYRGGSLPHNRGADTHKVLQLGLARFSRTRLIGYDTAGNRDARLLTGAFILSQPDIALDGDLRGACRAELCDPFGNPLPGYRREDFVPVRGDNPRHILRWQGQDTGRYLSDAVSLRLEMTAGTVYGLDV